MDNCEPGTEQLETGNSGGILLFFINLWYQTKPTNIKIYTTLSLSLSVSKDYIEATVQFLNSRLKLQIKILPPLLIHLKIGHVKENSELLVMREIKLCNNWGNNF